MIDLAVLKGSSFVVLGLARSGLATVRALSAAGIDCVAWDDNAASRETAAKIGVPVVEPASIDWSRATALIISPGIPSHLPKPHPVAAAARAAGKKIICDIELLARAQPKAGFVGITGTNGKSTTTALIGHILAEAGRRCEVGGNIGRGALDLAPLGPGGLYVLELSSYQLELLDSFHANVARSEEHTSELQSRLHLVCRLLLEKKKKTSTLEEKPRKITLKIDKIFT